MHLRGGRDVRFNPKSRTAPMPFSTPMEVGDRSRGGTHPARRQVLADSAPFRAAGASPTRARMLQSGGEDSVRRAVQPQLQTWNELVEKMVRMETSARRRPGNRMVKTDSTLERRSAYSCRVLVSTVFTYQPGI